MRPLPQTPVCASVALADAATSTWDPLGFTWAIQANVARILDGPHASICVPLLCCNGGTRWGSSYSICPGIFLVTPLLQGALLCPLKGPLYCVNFSVRPFGSGPPCITGVPWLACMSPRSLMLIARLPGFPYTPGRGGHVIGRVRCARGRPQF